MPSPDLSNHDCSGGPAREREIPVAAARNQIRARCSWIVSFVSTLQCPLVKLNAAVRSLFLRRAVLLVNGGPRLEELLCTWLGGLR